MLKRNITYVCRKLYPTLKLITPACLEGRVGAFPEVPWQEYAFIAARRFLTSLRTESRLPPPPLHSHPSKAHIVSRNPGSGAFWLNVNNQVIYNHNIYVLLVS